MYIVLWILWGLVTFLIAKNFEDKYGEKLGIGKWSWGILGVLFGIVPLIIQLIMYHSHKKKIETYTSSTVNEENVNNDNE